MELVNNSELENIKVKSFGYDDTFVTHGSTDELEKLYGQDEESILKEIVKSLEVETIG